MEAEDLCEIGGIPPEHRTEVQGHLVMFHVSEYEAERTAARD